MNDNQFLTRTLELAKEASEKGSVPIGALITDNNGNIIAEGYNEIKIIKDATAHAEIICIRKAGEKVIKSINQEPTTLYTTLEPCFACGFFITRTNISKVVWLLNDPYKGGIEFLKQTEKMSKDINRLVLVAEPLAELKTKSKNLMRQYYENKGDSKIAKLFE